MPPNVRPVRPPYHKDHQVRSASVTAPVPQAGTHKFPRPQIEGTEHGAN